MSEGGGEPQKVTTPPPLPRRKIPCVIMRLEVSPALSMQIKTAFNLIRSPSLRSRTLYEVDPRNLAVSRPLNAAFVAPERSV